ncbi:MAG: TraM recognition domain-containing protein [Hyphomicrobiaceae bacterium]
MAPTKIRPSDLPIGFDLNDHTHYVSRAARSRHHLILGLSGTGKSRFMEHMIRHDLRQGYGVCIIDPKGRNPHSVFNNTLRWLHAEGFCGDDPTKPKRTVRVIDPTHATHVTSLNPFAVTDDVRERADPYAIAGNLMKVFERVWQQQFIEYPLIARYLPAIFVALYEQRLTLADIPFIFGRATDEGRSVEQLGRRAALIEKIKHPLARTYLQDLDDLTKTEAGRRQYKEQVMGPLNRIEPFLALAATNQMFSGGVVAFDPVRVLDEGEVVLVNLSPDGLSFTEEAARVIGTYLVREFFRASKLRARHQRQFFVYIDEAANFLTDDVIKALDECRSEGLSFVLALQRLEQARAVSENMYSTILSEPNILSVFGGLDMEEAKRVADQLVKLDLERPIEILAKPTPTGEFEIVELASTSYTDGSGLAQSAFASQTETRGEFAARSRSGGSSQGFSGMASAGETLSPIIGPNGAPMVMMHSSFGTSNTFSDMTGWGEVEGRSQAISQGQAEGLTTSQNTARTTGKTQTLKALFAKLPGGVHSLENVRYVAAYQLRTQLPRHFFLSVDRQNAVRLAVPTVEAPRLSDDDLFAFKTKLLADDPAALPRREAARTVAQRIQHINDRLDNMLLDAAPGGRDVSDSAAVADPEITLDFDAAESPTPADNIVRLFPEKTDEPPEET